MAAQAAVKENKKVAIAATGINTNYDEQSAEYKAFRCAVNKWQKDTREYLASLGHDATKCFTFIVARGVFGITEKGKQLIKKLPEDIIEELAAERAELEKQFADTVING